MNYELSLGSFFLGIFIVITGVLFVRFYQWLADNLGGVVSSYERFKLFGLIACVLGLIVTINLHTFILGAVVRAIFPQL